MTIDLQPDWEVLRVWHVIRSHHPWSDGGEGVVRLAFRPLTLVIELKRPLRKVVDDAISGDMAERAIFTDVLRASTDYDPKFALPIALRGACWDLDIIVGTGRRGCRLQEDDWLRRDRHARFGGVVRIVQPYADDFSNRSYTGTQPRLATYQREFLYRERLQASDPGRRQNIPANVRDMG
jgi:hypothetical protein